MPAPVTGPAGTATTGCWPPWAKPTCSSATPPAGYEYCKYLTAQNQADFLVQAVTKARSLDYVGGLMVWNLNFQLAVPQGDEKWGFGVVRDDWTPRPAYFALTQMPKA